MRTRLDKLKKYIMLILSVVLLLGFTTIVSADESDDGIIATGTVGVGGAPWTLDSNGVVEVGGGMISHDGSRDTRSGCSCERFSPWHRHRNSITEIIFTEQVWGNNQLRGLFASLPHLRNIEGLRYIDTSNVNDMGNMFYNSTSLVSLDLSSWDTSSVTTMGNMFEKTESLISLDLSNWDTSNVTSMGRMFQGANSLSSLDVSNWDTSNVTSMSNMFWRADSLLSLDLSSWNTSNVTNMWAMFDETQLRMLILGEYFQFEEEGFSSRLPEITQTTEYTGYWQNVGTGTIELPNGEHVLTSAELITQFDGAIMADTFVWQRHPHFEYIVQWGDTLSELALLHGTTVADLQRLNNIENPDLILVGQILTLPDFRTYQMAMETVSVRFYRLYDDNGGDFIYEYTTAIISGENFAAEMVELANERFEYMRHDIDVWLVGNRLYVDLSPNTQRGLSSHETMTGLHVLLLTFTSVPSIDEVAFLNSGRSGSGFGKVAFSNGGLYLVDGPEIERIRSNHYIFQAYE